MFELKLCPLCGNQPISGLTGSHFYIKCEACILLIARPIIDKDKLIELWNTRYTPYVLGINVN